MARSLSAAATRGGAIVAGAQVVRTLVQLGGMAALGHFVPPDEFGLLAMAVAVVGVADVIRDLGLSSAAIQGKRLSDGQASNLFWLNTVVGIALAGAAAASAPLVAWVYGEPRVSAVTMAIAVTFAINGVQAQFQAHLSRAFRFLSLSITDLTAQILALAVAIWLAVEGWGVWALVWQVTSQATFLLILRVLTAGWLPGLPDRHESVRPHVAFGAYLSFTQILVYVSSNIDSALIGARFGSSAAGLYKRASQILLLPLNQLLAPMTGVALPVLSRLQDDSKRLQDYVVRAQLVVSYATSMIFALAAPLAPSLIPWIFGDLWVGSVPIFQILALGGTFQALNYSSGWVLMATGNTKAHFQYAVFSRGFLIAMLVLAGPFGSIWVAAMYSLAMVFLWPICLWWTQRASGVLMSRTLTGSFHALLVAGVGTTFGFVIDRLVAGAPLFSRVSATALGVLVSSVALAIALPQARGHLGALAMTVGEMRRGSRAETAGQE